MGQSAKRNVLLLIADDLGKYAGCYGCQSVKTPNLDQLASEGVRFDAAFASTASCSGSRSTIYTGLHTHENGQYGLNIFQTHFQTFPHIETLPKIFNSAGYLTGIIGKIHVGPDEAYPWSHRQESESRDVAWVADQTEAFFVKAKATQQPFCLTVGFVDPHRDVSTRGGFGNSEVYDSRVIPSPVNPDDVQVPSWLSDVPEVRMELAEYYQAVHRTDQGIGLILGAVARQGLNDDTLVVFTSDNGPPFLNAKTTLYDAGTCLPLLVRKPGTQPGIINPNMISYIDFLPTFLDWANLPATYTSSEATRLGYEQTLGSGFATEGSHSPPRLGRSFLPILESTCLLPDGDWRQRAFGSHTFHELHNYWPTRVLRTPRYKYHRNIAWRLDFPFAGDLYASYSYEGMRNAEPPTIGRRPLANYLFRPAEELYDLAQDPDEVNNLAANAGMKGILTQLRLELEQWQQQTRDLWLYRDGASVLALERYGKEGLHIPDRFDVDANNPSTRTKLVRVGPDMDLRGM